jgi:diguanylate cyclase (GGDEF)-like protein
MNLQQLLGVLEKNEAWFVRQAESGVYAAIDSNLWIEEVKNCLHWARDPLLKYGPLDEPGVWWLATGAAKSPIPNDSWRKLVALVRQAIAGEKAAREALDGGDLAHTSWRIDDPRRRDGLLPLGSKKCYDEDIEVAVREATTEVALALLVIDVDNFKSINDNHGPEAGNDVLRAIARVTASSASGKGKAYRWGGDELAVLLPNHTLPEAVAVAERIRLGVERFSFSSPELRATVTAGCAMLPEEPDRTPRGLFERADAVLRSAKHEGKNRVAVGVGQREVS